MSAQAFLFAADALRIEDGVSFTVETPAGPRRAEPQSVANRNAENMKKLGAMFGGVKGAPVKR